MITYFSKKGHINICEDSLTSMVFDFLKYLPIEMFWEILKKSLCQDKLPKVSGEEMQISFWEKWNADGTQNSIYVEPDVFIRFSKFNVIVEAKRYDENQQYKEQMTKEIKAYYNEFQDNKQLYFIQCGGLNNHNNEPDIKMNNNSVVICKTNWTKLLTEIVTLREQDYISNSQARILDDLIRGFELFGFFRKTWLNSLKLQKIGEATTDVFEWLCEVTSQDKWLYSLKSKEIENYNNINLFNYAKR